MIPKELYLFRPIATPLCTDRCRISKGQTSRRNITNMSSIWSLCASYGNARHLRYRPRPQQDFPFPRPHKCVQSTAPSRVPSQCNGAWTAHHNGIFGNSVVINGSGSHASARWWGRQHLLMALKGDGEDKKSSLEPMRLFPRVNGR